MDWEALDNKNSLISRLVEKQDVDQISEIITLFWMQRDKLTEKIKPKIKPLWMALIEVLRPRKEQPEYQKIISSLSKWSSLVDCIDRDTLEWLKLSADYVKADFNASFLIEPLVRHAERSPDEVAEIYLEMLKENTYPFFDEKDTTKIVEILYQKGLKESANKICNIYGAKGLDFLRAIYDKYN
jgi:hypothetical protein